MIKPDKLFYTPAYLGKELNYTLPEEESQHAVKVLRMQVGETIHLINGKGGLFEAEIINPHPKRCELNILSSVFEFGKRDFYLHIAIAPTKMNERLEWFLEKATEIGIDEITPVICRYSERKEVKLPRMEKIVVAAMKQSVKAYLPIINEACSFEQFIKKFPASQKYIAHCYQEEKALLQHVYKKGLDVLLLIGPEGDFSTDEVKLAVEYGYTPVSLGMSRLRTETAGVVACHTVNLLNE
ncbi:MAG: 16S rRNA (uracil(1498)-N(3))-methyltransferase [Paludibacteraceae bacterium]|nr:16S rRNA (uracil(1498)-N(3))-methyltransferase [Paludibacteraceae bacterium]MBN2788126.1 16S rRNA (uracil(1498)-N(3))-methyltransferase [Paludibacteraceae bacterium]